MQAGEDARFLQPLLQTVIQRAIGFVFSAGQGVLDGLGVTLVGRICFLVQSILQGFFIRLGGVHFLLGPVENVRLLQLHGLP